MKIDYARVSTQDQKLELQLNAFRRNAAASRPVQAAGCEQVFREKVSAVGKERPQLEKMTDLLRTGDVVIVWKLDGTGHPASGAFPEGAAGTRQ